MPRTCARTADACCVCEVGEMVGRRRTLIVGEESIDVVWIRRAIAVDVETVEEEAAEGEDRVERRVMVVKRCLWRRVHAMIPDVLKTFLGY